MLIIMFVVGISSGLFISDKISQVFVGADEPCLCYEELTKQDLEQAEEEGEVP